MSCSIILKEKGLKLTPQRRLIVETIHNTQAHLTAEEIISCVQSKMPGVHKSTIYRTLELLEKAGCLFKSDMGDQSIYHHADEGHHHHLVCRECGKTVDLEESLFTPLERSLADRYSFSIELKHVVIQGLCESCRDQAD